MDAVTAAVLADAAFDAVGEATKFSTRRYREKIEQLRQTGELTPGKESRAMKSKERSPAFWMAEAARTQASAETMKNPLAKTGMEHIAECYESFAKRAENSLAKDARCSVGRNRWTPLCRGVACGRRVSRWHGRPADGPLCPTAACFVRRTLYKEGPLRPLRSSC